MTRKTLIALAHLAAKQAGADEETRRAVQRKLTGVDSCAQMDAAALRAVIRYWQRHGASVRLPGPPPLGQQIAFSERSDAQVSRSSWKRWIGAIAASHWWRRPSGRW